MTFYIFSKAGRFVVESESGEQMVFASEAAAIDQAVRHAQDAGASAYCIEYWRPIA